MNCLKKRLETMDSTTKSSIKNFLVRPIGMILAAVYTPLLLNYLGTEANGVWATVLSVITWINYCDLGIGNGLRNLLAKELAQEDFESVQQSVSTAYIVLTGIALVLLAALMALSLLLDWNHILNTDLAVKPMMTITFIFIIINFILALSNSILYALQLSERVSVRSCIVQIFNIVGLLVLERFETGNLTHMAILFGASTAVVYVGNTLTVMYRRKYLRPKKNMFVKAKIREICSFGLQFFVIQLTAVLILSSHNLIAANLFGASAVTPLNTVSTVYAAGYSFMAALVVPMWSRTTAAITNGEFEWIRKAMKKVQLISIIFLVGFVFTALFFRDISRIWLGRELDYQPGVIAVTCLFYMMEVLNLIFVQFYYGMGEVTPYMWISVVQALAIVPLAVFLAKTMGLGVAGVKLAPTILLAVSGAVLPGMTYKKLSELKARSV